MALGGARPGPGRRKGGKNPETLEKERVLAALRQRIMQKANRILDSQMILANGQRPLQDRKGSRAAADVRSSRTGTRSGSQPQTLPAIH